MAYFDYGDSHKCLILGHQKRLNDHFIPALRAAVELGANPSKICQVYVASSSNDPGYGLIKVPDYYEPVIADGILLNERWSAVIMQTADCPTIVLTDDTTGNKVVAHAGRAALTPHGHCVDCTIVETALAQLGAKDRTKVKAFVLGDICGKCFLHDHESAAPLISSFLRIGDRVFDDVKRRGLSLFKVIRSRLEHAGVSPAHITHYGNCTYEHHRYASHRRDGDRNDRNHVIVVKTK